MSRFVSRRLGHVLTRAPARKLTAIAAMMVSVSLHAADVDLSGGWINDQGMQSTLVHHGSKVLEISNDPAFTAFFGEHLFIATFDGTTLRGKIATALKPEFKEFCGKNWGTWADFEMEMSSEGNRLEGRWKRGTQITTEVGCSLQNVTWVPYVLTRTTPMQPSVPNKRYWIGGLALLGLALFFFSIRGAFENYLVGSAKRAPNSAAMASWSLFGGLLFGSAIGNFALVDSSYFVLPVIVPLALLSLLCFVGCVVFSSKK